MDKDKKKNAGEVTLRAFMLGVFLSGLFAWITALLDNGDVIGHRSRSLSANLIPVLPHVLLLAVGLLVNPLLKRIRIMRLFTRPELLLIFVMTSVSAGVASWGLSGNLIPVISGLSNKAWNTDQSQWDAGVMPFLNENYFISGKGTQASAQHLREAFLTHKEARERYQVARDLQLAKAELDRVKADLAVIAATPDPAEREARERLMVWPHSQAVTLVERTGEDWNRIGGGEDLQTVLETYGEKIWVLKAELDVRRAALKALNKEAFESVEKIRKGLPVDKRAIPGFVYAQGEGFASYAARFKRLFIGRRSYRPLEQLAGDIALQGSLPPDAAETLKASALLLSSISDIPAISRRSEEYSARLADLEDQIALQEADGRQLRQSRRHSRQDQFQSYITRIDEVDARVASLRSDADRLRNRLEKQLRPQLDVCERVKTTQATLLALAGDVSSGGGIDRLVIEQQLQDVMDTYNGFDASWRRFCLGDAEWGIWLRPLFNWLVVIFLAYLVFMAFNTLIFKQWAHHEKLIYPLAEVVGLLAGEKDPGAKSMFRSGLFWTGFCIAAGILGWNFLATESIISNIKPVKLETLWINYVGGGVLRGVASTYFCMIFAVIGVSFLVPAKISFSLWFFEVLYMGLLLVMVWLGYGNDRWSLGNVGRSGLGAGAMLIFGFTILWTCRQYLLCVFKPAVLRGMPADESRELRVSSAIFLGGSLALMLVLTYGFGANPFFVFIFYLIIMTMMIALVRAVAEGGVLGIESSASVFGIMRTIFGMSGAWCSPLLVAPLLVFNGLLFGGFRALIGPMMANALKVREEFRMPRLYFHGSIWAGILVATVVSSVTLILLSYQYGADNLHPWLNNSKGTFDGVKGWVETFGPGKISERWWMLAGALLMGGLLFGRQRFFGMPHPIGLLMIMNPNMFGFWGSILIGWGCKHVVSKYCSHEQYVSVRRFFIGLIVGHLVAVLFGWDPLHFHWG